VKKYIRIFTLLSREEIEALEAEHDKAPHQRILQKKVAGEVTCMVHGREEYEKALGASQILFGKGTTESLSKLDEETFLSVFEGVPRFEISKTDWESSPQLIDLLTDLAPVFPSKGELRRLVKGGGLSVNKNKINQVEDTLSIDSLLNNKYLLVQKGKKNYFIIQVNS
jgi:tyrosyl-tRNA synthetase